MKLALSFVLLALFSLSSSQESLLWSILSLMFLFTLLNFTKSWNHIFLMLLNLEVMSLIFILSLTSISLFSNINVELFFVFFTFAVCEASLGIAILIFFSHLKGSESMYGLLKV